MNEEFIQELQELNQYSQEIERKSEIVRQQIIELDKFTEAIDELSENKNREIMASVGKGVFIKSKTEEQNLFVDVGAGVFIKKTFDETRDIINNQKRKLGEMNMQIESEEASLNSKMQELIKKIENK